MKLTEQITETIGEYKSTEIEAFNLGKLMNIRKHLSTLAYELGVEVARNKRQLETAIYHRKTNFYLKKKEFLDEGVTKAETLAESEIVKHRETEASYQGLYDFGKIILNQVNEVLSSIQQDISALKLEYKSEN